MKTGVFSVLRPRRERRFLKTSTISVPSSHLFQRFISHIQCPSVIEKSDGSVFKMIFGQKCSVSSLKDVSPTPSLGLFLLVVFDSITESDL